ncbi:MAG: transcription-repair coupling factor, partial [Actinobacteria bacterium]|nr:transcription-repair coupling factor [Actinomycetota bacterium]
MILEGLIAALSRAKTFENALASAKRSADFSLVDGLRAPLLAGLLTREGGPRMALAIVATGRESEALRRTLASYLPDAAIIEFPAWETLPHERLSPSAETVGKRIAALRAVKEWTLRQAQGPVEPLILVASVRAALQPLADNLTSIEPIALTKGGRGYDLADLSRRLVDLAYSRVDMVTRRGEFAVRGGILDVFAPTDEHPLRLEFFGDELETVREFSVADQRSLATEITEAELPPSRELLLSDAVRQRAREMQHEFPSLSTMLAKIGEGIPVDGMESLAPALVDRLVPLTHYLPPDAAIAVIAPEKVATRAVSLAETNREFLSAAWNAATAGAEAPIDLSRSLKTSLDAGDFVTLNVLRESAGGRPWWTLSAFDSGAPEELEASGLQPYVRLDGTAVPSFVGQAEGAVQHVKELLRDGWTVAVVAEGPGLVERAAQVLGEAGASGRVVEWFPVKGSPTEPGPEEGVAYLLKASVDHGFELPEIKLALLSESEFYGRAVGYDTRQVKKLASRRKNVVDPLQLKAGDFVVHNTHGIGKFLELVQREVSTGGRNAIKTQREFLVIEYAPNKRGYPGDKLYVPTDQLDLLSRY